VQNLELHLAGCCRRGHRLARKSGPLKSFRARWRPGARPKAPRQLRPASRGRRAAAARCRVGMGRGHIRTRLLDRSGRSGRRGGRWPILSRGLGRGRVVRGHARWRRVLHQPDGRRRPDAASASPPECCSSGEADLLRPRRRPSTIVQIIGQDSRCSSSPALKIRSSLSPKMFHVEPSTKPPRAWLDRTAEKFGAFRINPG